jgi:hypothetical protein
MYKSGGIDYFDDSLKPEWANSVETIDDQVIVEFANGDQMVLGPITGPGPKADFNESFQHNMRGESRIPVYQIDHYYIDTGNNSKRDIISDNSSFELKGEKIPAKYFFSFEGRASGHITLREDSDGGIRRFELLFSPVLDKLKDSNIPWSPIDTAFGIRTVLLHEMGHGRSFKDLPQDLDHTYKSTVLMERAANTNLVTYLRKIGVKNEEIIKMLNMAYIALDSYDDNAEINLRLFTQDNTAEANENFIGLSKQLLEDLLDEDMYPIRLEKFRSARNQIKGSIILSRHIEKLNTGIG